MKHRLAGIDLRLLHVFKVIVESNGPGGAQVVLNVAQSTISTQLAELEKRVGARLCYRGRSGFFLTKAGQHVYDACQDLFAAADRFQHSLASLSGNMKGTLRIAMVDAVLSNKDWDFPSVIRDFKSRAKEVIIELAVVAPEEVELRLEQGLCDVGIGSFFRQRHGLDYISIYEEEQSIYCAPHHPLARKKMVAVEELREHVFVARRYLSRYGLERIGDIETGALVENMEAQALLILSGSFIGYLPPHYVQTLSRQHKLHRIDVRENLDYSSPFYVLYKKTMAEELLIDTFLGCVGGGRVGDTWHQLQHGGRA